MNPILQVNQLCKSFQDFKAVENLSFSVYEGDIFGFLGENGAGKSTTIRIMLTLIKPTSGDIKLLGKNLQQNRNEILSQIGAVIERPDLYKYLSAYENLNLFARMSGLNISRNKLMDQLDVVGLADRSDSKVKTFSQGMKQRLGIAVSLVHDPTLIILDEPTNGLDPQGITDIRNLILRLSKERKKTILVSSHLLSEIEIIANRMLIIHKGKKVIEGEVKSLLDPSKSIVKIETTDNPTAFQLLEKSTWNENLKINERQIQLNIGKSAIPSLVRYLTENNIDIELIQPRHSLEDYFLTLTKTADNV
jgi:ABC-type multidrug transport system ATPase subunit